MPKLIKDVIEKIEEMELYGIIGWASVKAFITIIGLFLFGYYVLPIFLKGSLTTFFISYIATFSIMAYVFKVERDEYDRIFEFSIGSLLYATILYFFGELVFIGLILLGILIVVTFIIGDGFLTGLYTYIDLRKWLNIKIAEEEREKRLQEREAQVKGEEELT